MTHDLNSLSPASCLPANTDVTVNGLAAPGGGYGGGEGGTVKVVVLKQSIYYYLFKLGIVAKIFFNGLRRILLICRVYEVTNSLSGFSKLFAKVI